MKKFLIVIMLLVLCSGCATRQHSKDYTAFNAARPNSILVLPVINESVDVDAPDYFLSTISKPVAEQGYYVFPVNMVKRILEDSGLSDANLVHNMPTEKVAKLFGADSVLYIKIKRWDAQYVLLATKVTVGLDYAIKDGKTGIVLWKESKTVNYTPNEGSLSSNSLLENLIVNVVVAAATKAAPNYIPLAQEANAMTFTYPGSGIPPGKYLPEKEATNE